MPAWISYVLYDQLRVIKDVFKQHMVPFWLGFGTLLGAVRHRGLIPWDDHADIIVDVEHRPKIRKLGTVFKKLGFDLDCGDDPAETNYQLTNVYIPDAATVNNPDNAESPGTDIFFYTRNGTAEYTYPGECDFTASPFPLQQVPFGNFTLPIPNRKVTDHHLNQLYPGWRKKIVIDPYHMNSMQPRPRRELDMTVSFSNTDVPLAPTQEHTCRDFPRKPRHSQWHTW